MAQPDPVRLAVIVGFVGASLFAAYGGYRAIAGAHSEGPAAPVAAAGQPGTPVLTASAPIARGDEIVPSKLRAISVEGTPPAGSFAAPEAVVGKVALADILPGQILLPGMISADPADGGLAMLIPHGKRAIAIPIAEDSAVSNMVRAGDLVDVLLVLRSGVLPHGPGGPVRPGAPSDPGDASETRVLLQAVPVLTVGEHISHSRPPLPGEPGAPQGGTQGGPAQRPEPSRTLTLALTPEQAETLALARTLGSIELALRNPHDTGVSLSPPVTLQELRGAALRPETTVSADPRRPIELIVGNEHRTIYSLDAMTPSESASEAALTRRAPRTLAP